MPRIQQLPPLVISQISAGEVIERPASVIKELLENAIDAGATRIDVEVGHGGVDLIRVVDNGSGILPDDLPLAFARHATSKLASAEDLFQVGTLGFRGEALASIGGVAQVTLQSRPPELLAGAEMTCHGGDLSAVRAWNGSPGTRIEVRHLFYNTPVRRKFLRSHGHRGGPHQRGAEPLGPVAPRPPHLTLRHNGKLVQEVPLTARLARPGDLFFGAEVCGSLYPVEASEGPMTLQGYIGDPSCERGNAQHPVPVRQRAMDSGPGTIPRPAGGLPGPADDRPLRRGLPVPGIPPDQVDVNVHPTKAECVSVTLMLFTRWS